MKTVELGSTGVEVSAMCLGLMLYGTVTDEEIARTLMDGYAEAGGRFLDTANAYAHWYKGASGGESEALLGRWLADRGNRDEFFIATKVGFSYPGTPDGLRAEQIETECEKSLRRIGIETIDIYYAHRDDRNTPLSETLEAFDKLVKAGKVRFIGASNYVAWRLADALAASRSNDWAAYACVQQKHSYLRAKVGVDFDHWPVANPDFLELCKAKGLGVLAYSPLLRGAYTREDRPLNDMYTGPDTDARLAAVKALVAEKGVTANQVVLAWLMHSDPVVIPLFSVSKPDQLAEDLDALDVELSDDEMARLNDASA